LKALAMAEKISGDPGVGGLLADPEDGGKTAPALPARQPNSARATPDPVPPEKHHDWSPNKKPATDAKPETSS
jgi:hypothetical protein